MARIRRVGRDLSSQISMGARLRAIFRILPRPDTHEARVGAPLTLRGPHSSVGVAPPGRLVWDHLDVASRSATARRTAIRPEAGA